MKLIFVLSFLVGHAVFGQEKFTLDYQFGRSSVPNNQLSEFSKFLKEFKKTTNRFDTVYRFF